MKAKCTLLLLCGSLLVFGVAPAMGQLYTVVPATDTPITDPSAMGGAVSVNQGDDGCTDISFGGSTFDFYGVTWTGVWINNNGNLTFGASDYSYTESVGEFLAPEPRVGGFWDDLNPSAGGDVYGNLLADRFVVTWVNVPEYSTGGSNTFQITLEFATGTITMNFDSLTAVDSIVGVGPGTGYVYNGEVDFSAILGGGGAGYGVNEAILEEFTGGGDSFDLSATTMMFSPDLDPDGDGVDIPYDNCPFTYNPSQTDSDVDGVGDACDACPGFDDFDDADADEIPDGCDACPNDPYNDIDGDGWCGDVDNCPRTYNPGQEDSDGDGVGDACPYRPSVEVAIVETNVVRNGGTFPISGGPFDDFNFSFLQVVAVDAASLAPFDTVLLNVGGYTGWGSYCDTGYLTPTQKADLLSWVVAGGKLIISDSECPSADYSWLPYPFTTNNPGAMGAQGTLFIAEENVLSTSDPDDIYYIDAATLGSQTDAVGDMNVMTTYDEHWCLDMSGTNITPVTGPVHTYARYGDGLMIYNGLDMDYLGSGSDPLNGLAEIWLQELQVTFNPTPLAYLPCGIVVVGIALTPLEAENEVGEEHTVTATLTDIGGVPQAGVQVTTFTVLSGPNAGAAGTWDPADGITGANGQVTFTYTGSGGVGTDVIQACFDDEEGVEHCSQEVTKTWVSTDLPPVALCQDVFAATDGNCEGHAAPEEADAGSFDPEGGPITRVLDPPGPYSLGTHDVTLTVTDDGGLSDTCTATVTVVDGPDTPPEITCPGDGTVECDGTGNPTELNAWLAGATATDNCGEVTITNDFTGLSDDCGATGSATVMWAATDSAGNTATCSATFTILDTAPPSITCPGDMTVECDGAGNTAELNAWLASATASDTCGSVSISNDFAGLSDDCGATGSATVTWTATDDCGLAATCSATFTIEDTTPPSIDIPAGDLTVECDGAGNLAELNTWLGSHGGAAAWDICCDGDITWANNFTGLSDDCGATGSATVTFTATDCCDLTSSTTVTFTIEDTIAPDIYCPDDVIVTCPESTDPADTGMATGEDDCGDVMITYSDEVTPAADPVDPVMYTIARTWTATDECSLTGECVQTITVLRQAWGLIIKQGACPAPVNPDSHGVVPMVLTGDVGFDVTQVVQDTVRLVRADGVGGEAAPSPGSPPGFQFKDINHPYVGEGPCSCNEDQASDGIMDLQLKFRTDDLVDALLLDELPSGSIVVLVLIGELENGCELIASDCIRIVPPGGYHCISLLVESDRPELWVQLSPLDDTLDDEGFTDFERAYPEGTLATLTVPLGEVTGRFVGWRIDGTLQRSAARTLELLLTEDTTVEVVYRGGPSEGLSTAPAPSEETPATEARPGAGSERPDDRLEYDPG